VEVGDEVETIVFGLELEVLAHCTKVVADVESAGRLYAGENSQFTLLQKELPKSASK
jgi:hypothetical protein